jgi:RNA polymerase sigma-70 factor, ECF subfamily
MTSRTETDPIDTNLPALDLGDAEAFARWYADHWLRAVALAAHLSGNASMAEDLAADALARAWQRWQVMGTPERPWAYVTASIRNLAVTHFRRSDRERDHFARLHGPDAAASPEARVIDRQLVHGLLSRLPDTERTAVALHYLDDLAGADVAEHLSVRPATVRSHLHRARRRLAVRSAA